MSFERVVQAVQAIALVAALVFVVMLFANDGGDTNGGSGGDGGNGRGGPVSLGERIYQDRCAGCHGSDARGGLGPALAGRVTERFPDVEDQLAVVREGRGTMPAFGDELDESELLAVVEYTRGLGGDG